MGTYLEVSIKNMELSNGDISNAALRGERRICKVSKSKFLVWSTVVMELVTFTFLTWALIGAASVLVSVKSTSFRSFKQAEKHEKRSVLAKKAKLSKEGFLSQRLLLIELALYDLKI